MPIYIIAQAFGILSTAMGLVMPLFKKKWKILMCAVGANLFVCLNLILLGEISSGAYLAGVGVVQSLIAFFHIRSDKPVSLPEKISFLIIYVVFGILGYKNLIDIVPIVASVFYMLSVFVLDEQDTRKLMLGNFLCWSIYDASVLATAFFGHFAGFCTTTFALWKYRNKRSE